VVAYETFIGNQGKKALSSGVLQWYGSAAKPAFGKAVKLHRINSKKRTRRFYEYVPG